MDGGKFDVNEPTVSSDERLDFIKDFILKAFRVKIEKWDRMYISDEQRAFIHRFLDTEKPQVMTTYLLVNFFSFTICIFLIVKKMFSYKLIDIYKVTKIDLRYIPRYNLIDYGHEIMYLVCEEVSLVRKGGNRE